MVFIRFSQVLAILTNVKGYQNWVRGMRAFVVFCVYLEMFIINSFKNDMQTMQ